MAGEPILIVEDNDKNLKLMRDLLRATGYRTLEAHAAEDGIALAIARRPDPILMDIQLPGMDGATARGRLRAEPATEAIPVIALTAFAMAADRERFLLADFDDYLTKPIDITALLEGVRRHCARAP
jgi:two-component system cell cycle response regulator DivK